VTLFAAVDFDRAMRIGSLEITAALALVAVLAARPRIRTAAEIGRVTPMDVELRVRQPAGSEPYRGRAPLVLGRDRSADLVVHDPEVSRRHARLESHEGLLYVIDLNSSNGTFLNGRRVTEPIEVREGDEIDVGTTRIRVVSLRPG
jgi:hypothetical protein